jgi:4-diphosphocytidyl-2-C-methyl-D-erythritol kinase
VTRLRALAPAKVNLCLFLGPTRSDGRHELVTLFESISLSDELELTPLDVGEDQVICPGVQGPNLAASALAELRGAGWEGPPVRVEIRKRIPVAAGLGGGSADAAAVLRLVQALAPIPEELPGRVARELGADVPSQLQPGLAVGTGAGEHVEPLEPLAPHAFLIVPQPFGLSTAEVYREADRLGLPRTVGGLAARRRELMAAATPGDRLPPGLLVNDLERAAISLAGAVSGVLEAVRGAGAEHVLLCGSGPTVAGLWWGEDSERWARAAQDRLAPDHPGACVATPVHRPKGILVLRHN